MKRKRNQLLAVNIEEQQNPALAFFSNDNYKLSETAIFRHLSAQQTDMSKLMFDLPTDVQHTRDKHQTSEATTSRNYTIQG